MKKFSIGKWVLLAGALAFAYACNCQKSMQPAKKAPSHEEEEDEDREDGDMCSIPSDSQREEQVSSPPNAPSDAKSVVEQATTFQEKKGESAPKSEVLENRSTVEAPAPEKTSTETSDSAVL